MTWRLPPPRCEIQGGLSCQHAIITCLLAKCRRPSLPSGSSIMAPGLNPVVIAMK